MSESHWKFSGTVKAIDPRTSKQGKSFAEMVIEQAHDKYPSICVCTFWGSLPDGVEVGADVEASGYMAGREYNGKYYAGLRATFVKAVGLAKKQDTQSITQHDHPADSQDADSNTPF